MPLVFNTYALPVELVSGRKDCLKFFATLVKLVPYQGYICQNHSPMQKDLIVPSIILHSLVPQIGFDKDNFSFDAINYLFDGKHWVKLDPMEMWQCRL